MTKTIADPAVVGRPGDLPHEVRDLAERLGVEINPGEALVYLRQSGRMRSDPRGAWMPFRAKQTIAIDHCGFDWRASTGLGGLIQVRDALVHNQGELTVSAFGIVPLARLRGSPELTRGEVLRYMAELPFAPDAITFNKNLRWRALAPRVFSVEAGEGDLAAEIRCNLDDEGRITEVYAEARPRAIKRGFAPTPWRGRFSDYRHHHKRWIPFAGEVSWIIDGQEFVYWQGRIEDWTMQANRCAGEAA